MANKILLVDLFVSYGHGTTLIKKIGSSFERLGYIPVFLDVNSPTAAQTLRQCIQEKQDYLFSFSTGWGITDASKIDGKYIHQWLEVPHFACLVNHPLYKHAIIDHRLKDVLYGFSDETQVTFCKFFYKNGNYAFFPHFSLVDVDELISEVEFDKRDKSVFFSGGAAIMERGWSSNISSPLQNKTVCALKETGVDIEGLIDHFLCKEDDPPPGYHFNQSAPIASSPFGGKRSTDRECIYRNRYRYKSHKTKARLEGIIRHGTRYRRWRVGSV
ncbi:MAG: hypothetical protein HY082_11435 [Gammaproteobacteria bacterium]|nr:hypothetical protein [Gammaproteobacteria bacterium]